MFIQLHVAKQVCRITFFCALIIWITIFSISAFAQDNEPSLLTYLQELQIQAQNDFEIRPIIYLRNPSGLDEFKFISLGDAGGINTILRSIGDDYFCVLRQEGESATRFCSIESNIAYVSHFIPLRSEEFPIVLPEAGTSTLENIFWEVNQLLELNNRNNEQITELRLQSPPGFKFSFEFPYQRARVTVVGNDYFCIDRVSDPTPGYDRFCIPFSNFLSITQTAPADYFSEFSLDAPLESEPTLEVGS